MTKRKSVWGIALKDGTLQTGMAVFGKRSEAEDAIAKISHLSDGFEAVELGALISLVIPDGWQLVPIEPTTEMINAALASGAISIRTAYSAMLAAAPKQEN
ncbi:hypothetical protein ACUNGV_25830 [Serratia sp. IR-2025]